MKNFNAISLFSSSGIGDIALKRLGIHTIVANELIEDRASLFKRNFSNSCMIQGSVYDKKEEIIENTLIRLNGTTLDYALVTPPCQGMSKNGRGKLLSEINAGRRPKVDPRNLLILPALEILNKLQPNTIVFENVSEMINTSIPYNEDIMNIIDIIKITLKNYFVETQIIEFADYGIPQRRRRLITIATKDANLQNYVKNFGSLFPQKTHSKDGLNGLKKWISIKDVIGKLEKLDAKYKLNSLKDPLHRVSKLDDQKYFWISNTPKNKSAFNNQCVECGFKDNELHTSKRSRKGVNRASKDTPISCQRCGANLPRPTVYRDGQRKLMSGFTSAYKRMNWDLPAPAITRNFPYVCSDNKVHPEQNRTLSIREACLLHTIYDGDFIFEYENKKSAKLTTIRDTLGESIPPRVLEIFLRHLQNITAQKYATKQNFRQHSLIFSQPV